MKHFSYFCRPLENNARAERDMADRIFLIDGHAMVFKMYYAFLRRPMVNSKGADMSILYGFTKYILELIEHQQPTHFAVAFDPPGGTFRNKMYEAYKANRPPTPQLVIDALEPLTELCHALNIPTLMMPGFEADDVIGSMAKRCASEGLDVYMVTPDKDYGQLIGEHIWQWKPGKGGGDDEVIGVKEICEKYGISSPLQVIEMLTICGDTADNVPGVKGVGEVGASKLVAKYGTVEGIYSHISELSPKQQAMFEQARGYIGLSHDLVTIKTDIEVPVTTEEARVDRNYSPLAADLFAKYEFNSLRKYLGGVRASATAGAKVPEAVSASPKEVSAAARSEGRCAVIVEGEDGGIFTETRRIIVAAPAAEGYVCATGGCKEFKDLLEDANVAKCGDDLKRQMNILSAGGVCLAGTLYDIPLMHYLIDPEKSHKLETLSAGYLGIPLETPDSKAVSATGSLFDDIPSDEAETDRSREAVILLELQKVLSGEMEKASAAKLYHSMEEPLLKVLSRMERNGVKVDMASLREFAAMLQKEMDSREKTIREMAEEPSLNVSSPKQIGEVLFGKMKLSARPKKNANGTYSTDEATLLDVAPKHPIVEEILEFRAAKKLLSTYIEPFPGYVNPVDGKVHTTFNQALTATGRLSSSGPNLQNIPIRTERGRQIRKAFVPETPDGLILSADYSQIELRIMAHLSCDKHLIEAFRNGIDVHAATAEKIFKVSHDEVTAEQRRIAKTANFGIMYGISAFGLAQRLRIGRKEAQKIIDDYFAAFPSIQSFIEDTKASARETGYVETIFGRRRYIPDINAKNNNARALAERNAVNAPIQGTSADIIKLAMIAVDLRMQKEGFRSRMVLQIHDELVFDAVPEEIEALKALVVEEMENVTQLSVPLTVECNYGRNWLEAH